MLRRSAESRARHGRACPDHPRRSATAMGRALQTGPTGQDSCQKQRATPHPALRAKIQTSSIKPSRCRSAGNRRLCRATAPPQSARRHRRSSRRNSGPRDAAPFRTVRRPPTRGRRTSAGTGRTSISVRTRKSSTADAAFRTSIPSDRATATAVSHTASGDVNRTGYFWARARSSRASRSSVSIAVSAEASTNIRTSRTGRR